MLSLQDEGRALSITCGDNGVGLPEGYDWEKPETVGLLLVQGLVEQMEGTIENALGTGTWFKIRVQKATGASGPMRGTYNQVPE